MVTFLGTSFAQCFYYITEKLIIYSLNLYIHSPSLVLTPNGSIILKKLSWKLQAVVLMLSCYSKGKMQSGVL